jgi:hypothetical protein
MTKTLMSLSVAALIATLAAPASAVTFSSLDSAIARAERPEKAEKPEKPQKPEKIGAIEGQFQLAREASEGPRGRDNERPGDRQRRGGRG